MIERNISERKIGKYHLPIPWFFRNSVKVALMTAEQRKGAPVYMIEIYGEWKRSQFCHYIYNSHVSIIACLWDLYTNDECMTDCEFNRFSADSSRQHIDFQDETGLYLYSDYYSKKYGHLQLDDAGVLYPKEDTPTLNFEYLRDLLLSKDLSRVSELEWIGKEPVRFLDNTVDMTGNKVGLASFMRSGNTFLKKFIEGVTGVTTGSEFKGDLILQVAGLVGEGHNANDRVWVTKVHRPFECPHSHKSCEINRQIVLMRNPLDNLVSLANLEMLISHSLTHKKPWKEHVDFWRFICSDGPRVWQDFLDIHMKESAQQVPTLYLRYEDLILDPLKTVTDVIRFMLDAPSLIGTVAEF